MLRTLCIVLIAFSMGIQGSLSVARAQEVPVALEELPQELPQDQTSTGAKNPPPQEPIPPETGPVPESETVVSPGEPGVVAGPQAPPPPTEVPTPAFSVMDESEPNDLEPQVIPNNADVRGQLNTAFDQDLFQFTITATSKVTIVLRNMEPIPPTTNGLFPVGWRVSLFGSMEHQAPYTLVFGARLDKPAATRTMGLWAGTYVVRISPPFNIPIAGFSKKPYTLEVRTEPLGNTRDIEPNDTSVGAILIDTNGAPFTGWFQRVDDTDYYRMNIVNLSPGPEAQPIQGASTAWTISASIPGEPSQDINLETTMCLRDVTIFAADDVNTPIASFCLLKGRATGYTLYLDTGLYFIRVKAKPFNSEPSSYTISIKPGQF